MTSRPSARCEMYLNGDLRRAILSQLGRADLASYMRASKDCFVEAVEEPYKSMCYKRVLDHMPDETPRQLQYLAAVREVHECSSRLGPDSICVLRTESRYKGIYHTAESYSVGSFNTMVPPILAKCPLLRKAIFGNGDDDHNFEGDDCDQWVVEFDSLGHGGQIIVDRVIGLPIQSLPPKTIEVHLFLWTDPENPIPSLLAEWLAAFRRKPCMTTLYGSIDFEELPVHLADITDLCVQQSESDHSVRFELIGAERVSPWSLYDFENFATAASTSLRYLSLTGRQDADELLGSGMTFADLPAFITIVRERLANLITLSFGMSGSETAEAVCFGMLDGDTLEDGGFIESVDVNTGHLHHGVPAFNVLRVLSRLCKPTGIMRMDKVEQSRGYKPKDFLPYLRSQPLHRRRHLSTVDFTNLGLTRLDQVQYLDYDEEGRPLPLSKIAEVQGQQGCDAEAEG